MTTPTFLERYKTLIATPSISATDRRWDQSNEAVISHLAQWCEDLGFHVETEQVSQGKWNLLAKKGQGEGGLLLSGHSDTVPFDENRWESDPFTLIEKNHRFYGLGTADMKGFFAFILEAIQQRENWTHQTKPLYILATCDEETSMQGAKHFQQSHHFTPDCCLIGEPTQLTPIYAHKGHLSTAIRITGKSGHSSDPAKGINALEIMQAVLFALIQVKNDLIKRHHHPGFEVPYPTLNLGHIHGGDNANRICGCCELHFDLRPLPGLSLAALDDLVHNALQPLQQKYPSAIAITPLHEPIPPFECRADAEHLAYFEELTGQAKTTANYCTEAAYFQHRMPTLVIGPGSIEQAHQPNEYLEQKYITPTINLLNRAISKYCFS